MTLHRRHGIFSTRGNVNPGNVLVIDVPSETIRMFDLPDVTQEEKDILILALTEISLKVLNNANKDFCNKKLLVIHNLQHKIMISDERMQF